MRSPGGQAPSRIDVATSNSCGTAGLLEVEEAQRTISNSGASAIGLETNPSARSDGVLRAGFDSGFPFLAVEKDRDAGGGGCRSAAAAATTAKPPSSPSNEVIGDLIAPVSEQKI